MEMERKSSALMAKSALKDCLSKVVASYNKMCTNKRHKVDSVKRALVYNMYFGSCLVCVSFLFVGLCLRLCAPKNDGIMFSKQSELFA